MRVRAGCEQILVATVDNSFKLQSNYHKHRGYDIGIARGEIRVNLINVCACDETRGVETSLQEIEHRNLNVFLQHVRSHGRRCG